MFGKERGTASFKDNLMNGYERKKNSCEQNSTNVNYITRLGRGWSFVVKCKKINEN